MLVAAKLREPLLFLQARLVVLLVVVLALGTIAVRAEENASPLSRPAVAFDRSPETLLVAYREIATELAEQDPTPLVRIYGDGTLRVHRPADTFGAGTYEARLEAEELEELLVMIASAVDSFDARAAKLAKQDAVEARVEAARAAGEPVVFDGVSDDSISVFELRLLGYRPAGATFFAGEIRQEVSWLGLETDAARFPGVESIQRLREVELALRALLERDDLERTGG